MVALPEAAVEEEEEKKEDAEKKEEEKKEEEEEEPAGPVLHKPSETGGEKRGGAAFGRSKQVGKSAF